MVGCIYPATYFSGDTTIIENITSATSEQNLVQGGNTSGVPRMIIEILEPDFNSVIKYYNGTEFVNCDVNYYNGSEFVLCEVKYFDGTSWVDIGG